MTDLDNQALDAAIVAAGMDPRNPAVREAWQAGIEKYIEVRNAEAIAYVCEADIRHLATQIDGTDMSIAPRPFPEYGMRFPLFPAPSAGGETVKAGDIAIALGKLTSAASEVAKHGAITGPQWVKMNLAIVSAKAALQRLSAPSSETDKEKGR